MCWPAASVIMMPVLPPRVPLVGMMPIESSSPAPKEVSVDDLRLTPEKPLVLSTSKRMEKVQLPNCWLPSESVR